MSLLHIIMLKIQCQQKNTSDPYTFCNKSMEQIRLKYFSRAIKFYIHVKDGITSLPANIGTIRTKKRFLVIFQFFWEKFISSELWQLASSKKKYHLIVRQKLYNKWLIIKFRAIKISGVIAILSFFKSLRYKKQEMQTPQKRCQTASSI